MSENPIQGELPLQMEFSSLDRLVISAQVALDRPEVEYQIHYTPRNSRQIVDRMWLDSVWPMERMIPKIVAMLSDHMEGVMWTKPEVQKILNAIQRTYGCEEPF